MFHFICSIHKPVVFTSTVTRIEKRKGKNKKNKKKQKNNNKMQVMHVVVPFQF